MSATPQSAPIDVTDADFEQLVLKADVPVLVDFWAEWCGPCKVIGPTIAEVAADFGDRVRVAKVDVDANQATAMRFGVRSIPTLILFTNGEASETRVGVRPKSELVELVEQHL